VSATEPLAATTRTNAGQQCRHTHKTRSGPSILKKGVCPRPTFAKRMRPSAPSGYLSCTSLVAASQAGSSRWHQWHQGAKKLTTTMG
jgi:hypothetical protein